MVIFLISIPVFLVIDYAISKGVAKCILLDFPLSKLPLVSFYFFLFSFLLPLSTEVKRIYSHGQSHRLGAIITSRASAIDFIFLGASVSLGFYFFWLWLGSIEKHGYDPWNSVFFENLDFTDYLKFILIYVIVVGVSFAAGHALSFIFI